LRLLLRRRLLLHLLLHRGMNLMRHRLHRLLVLLLLLRRSTRLLDLSLHRVGRLLLHWRHGLRLGVHRLGAHRLLLHHLLVLNVLHVVMHWLHRLHRLLLHRLVATILHRRSRVRGISPALRLSIWTLVVSLLRNITAATHSTATTHAATSGTTSSLVVDRLLLVPLLLVLHRHITLSATAASTHRRATRSSRSTHRSLGRAASTRLIHVVHRRNSVFSVRGEVDNDVGWLCCQRDTTSATAAVALTEILV